MAFVSLIGTESWSDHTARLGLVLPDSKPIPGGIPAASGKVALTWGATRMLAPIGTSRRSTARGLSTDPMSWPYHPTLLRIPVSSLRLGLRPCSRLNCLSR
jgi:hypothetical protein